MSSRFANVLVKLKPQFWRQISQNSLYLPRRGHQMPTHLCGSSTSKTQLHILSGKILIPTADMRYESRINICMGQMMDRLFPSLSLSAPTSSPNVCAIGKQKSTKTEIISSGKTTRNESSTMVYWLVQFSPSSVAFPSKLSPLMSLSQDNSYLFQT